MGRKIIQTNITNTNGVIDKSYREPNLVVLVL